MTHFRVAAVLLFFLSAEAFAAFTDFEDLAPGTQYSVGDQIISKGLTLDVVSFGTSTSKIYVYDFGTVFDSDIALYLGDKIGLEIAIPSGTSEISLWYYEESSGAQIVVNGSSATAMGSLSSLDGITVGGTLVSANYLGDQAGILRVVGNLTSFAIGGTELGIDDIRIVPEPAAWHLFATGAMALIAFSFRRPRFVSREESSEATAA